MSAQPLKLGSLGRGRRWAEYVRDTGERIPIVDEAGHEVAYLMPATEPITEALLAELEARLPKGEAREQFREWTAGLAGNERWEYHRPTGTFRSKP